MIPKTYNTTLSNKAREITFLRMVIGGLMFMVVMEGMLLFRTLGLEKTIITPPKIEKSFWVSGAGFSRSYLEQMAYWYAGLALNVTPSTGTYQKELFLHYASPDKLGALTIDADKRLDYVAKNNLSTMFTVQTMNTDEKLMRVALAGQLDTFVQDKRLPSRQAIFVIAFKNVNGQLFVDEFKETNEKDIFGTGTLGK